MTKDSVVESPADIILSGAITKIEKGQLREFIKPEYHSKFDNNLDKETLLVHFEARFDERIIGGTEKVAYYAEPMSNSKLGKIITKYGEFRVGKEIKIQFDGDGFSHIVTK